jgi:hypothetical protein
MFDWANQDVPPRCWTSLLLFRMGEPMARPPGVDARSIEWLVGCGLIERVGDSQYRIAEMGRQLIRRGRLKTYSAGLGSQAAQTPPHAPGRRIV